MEKRQTFGMWKKQVKLKTGATAEVFNFTLNGVRYTAWPNNKKSSEKSPDYNIMVDTYEPKNSNGSSGRQTSAATRNTQSSGASWQAVDNDDSGSLPF